MGDAIIDGEVCCIDDAGKSCFNDLMAGTRQPYFAAFDLLWLNGEDLRQLPLIARKERLKAIVPAAPSFLIYLDHIEGKGTNLFSLACASDLEGIVAKPKRSPYDPARTKWFKVKNPNYSQREGRREMFNSFMGYNDVAHVRQLTKEVTWVARPEPMRGGELWPPAAKTGIAYQESFVWREPTSVTTSIVDRGRTPNERQFSRAPSKLSRSPNCCSGRPTESRRVT